MDTSITIDTEIQQHTKLQQANRAMDDLLGSASGILGSITKQGVTLKVYLPSNQCVFVYLATNMSLAMKLSNTYGKPFEAYSQILTFPYTHVN